MIKHYSGFGQPMPSSTLWRFMDFTKFISMIDSRGLFFTRLRNMQDKHEGVLTRPTVEAWKKACEDFYGKEDWPQHYAEHMKQYKRVRETVYVSCWHRNEQESAAMWELYLSSNEGIAIRTTYADMKKALKNESAVIYPANVKYIDFTSTEFNLDDELLLAAMKRKSYSHESEFRLIWNSMDVSNRLRGVRRGFKFNHVYDDVGYAIPCDLDVLIQDVYVSPAAPSWFVKVVNSVLHKFEIEKECRRSDLNDEPVW